MLANVKMIAEPWDIGLGGYQVGGFPPGWSEWNDVYRRTMRRYWRGDGNLLGDLASALTGSAAQFRHDGRGPQASVNHVTVHDGFTLADLVSYEHKHNEANKEDNRDGSDDNNSLNCGVEGPTDDPAILERRRLLRRNQLASLLLAQGVPLILAGDEVGNTQGGNNNAYCQDDEIGWVNWCESRQRRRHDRIRRRPDAAAPALRASFARGTGSKARRPMAPTTVLWLRPDGEEMKDEDWNFPEGRFLAYVLAAADEGGEPLLIVFNAAENGVELTLPPWPNVAKLGPRARHRRRCGAEQRAGRAARSQADRPADFDPGLRGQAMIEANPFGPLITPENVIFRLWAPGAQRVELLHHQNHEMQRTDDGWFKLTIPGARPGDRYKFRIDGEIEVPDPASRFQPEDVHGPSEVIDHGAIDWQTRALDRPAVARMRVSGTACRHLHRETARFAASSTSSTTSPRRASPPSS